MKKLKPPIILLYSLAKAPSYLAKRSAMTYSRCGKCCSKTAKKEANSF